MMNYAAPTAYERVDPEVLKALRSQHSWIAEPIYRASDIVLQLPFFSWVAQIKSPLEFKPTFMD
jgi:hypothetical protein